MRKTSPIVFLLLVIALMLTGCSGTAQTGAATGGTGATQGQVATVSATLKDKLAVGTLKLEGTDLAVTPEQAATLLPLWKAVKNLASSDTTSQLEIEAIYQQIQDTLTAEQLASIEALDVSAANLQTLMSDLGIEMPAPDAGLSDSERATKIAELRASGNLPQGGGPGGGPSDGGPNGGGTFSQGGGPGNAMTDGGMIIEGNGVPPDGATGTLQGTPQPGQFASRGAMNMGSIFIDPLIELLKTRSAE